MYGWLRRILTRSSPQAGSSGGLIGRTEGGLMAGKRDWGRIRQLPSGRWQARYPGPDGRLRSAPHTFERKGDASNWLADKRTEINRDEWIDPDAGKVTFGAYAAIWMKERDLADTTAERYEGILRNYIEPHLGRRALSEIKEPAIRQWRKTCKMPA
jgi:hypothetical protein